ncbi:hypothetical protein V866_001255 [Kwoniella sp. B9012]
MVARFARRLSRPRLIASTASAGLLYSVYTLQDDPMSSSSKSSPPDFDPMLRSMSFGSLLGTWIVYKSCSFPALVDSSEKVLSLTNDIPGLRQLTHLVIRHTFFKQFVGGDTAEDCIPTIKRLRDNNIGCLLTYSVEEESAGQPHQQEATATTRANVKETIRSIEIAGQVNKRMTPVGQIGSTWIALKLTGMTDPEILRRASDLILRRRNDRAVGESSDSLIPYPGSPSQSDLLDYLEYHKSYLSDEDIKGLKVLHEDMRSILRTAQENGVRILIDSEQSWYQPATDVMQMILSQEFNRIPDASQSNAQAVLPLVYGTYQSYLRRNIQHLQRSLEHARQHEYCLGIKLVRGAYREQELQFWSDGRKEGIPPVWSTKVETDICYNSCLDLVVDRIGSDVGKSSPSVGLVLATHNHQSAEHLIERMKVLNMVKVTSQGLEVMPSTRKSITIAQLYGMNDDMSSRLSHAFTPKGEPMITKYVPYGALAEVMPYLSRRAVENKSILDGDKGAKREAERVWMEMKRRLSFVF